MGAVRELMRELLPVLVLGVLMACLAMPVALLLVWLEVEPVSALIVGAGCWSGLTLCGCMWAFGDRLGPGSSRWDDAKAKAQKRAAQRGDLSGVE
jgi:hypothetical protein